MFALVRTDPDAKPRHAGITMLLLDMHSPGITVRPIQTLKGDAEFAEEFFDDVRVPKDNMLGGLNQGWRIAGMVLGGERFTTGHPRYALIYLQQARELAKRSGAWDDAGFRERLTTLEIDLLAFLAYYRHAAKLHGTKAAPLSIAPVIKVAGGTLAQRSADLLVQAAGEIGASADDTPLISGAVNVAAELFEMRRLSVGSGTTEINRNIISKRVLGLPDAER
jgi:alkylation response protein AidB-like acyl-CoA dehydrogenase